MWVEVAYFEVQATNYYLFWQNYGSTAAQATISIYQVHNQHGYTSKEIAVI